MRGDKDKREPRALLYLVFEDADLAWYAEEVQAARQMYQDGLDIRDMADALDRDTDEVALLLMDLARKGKIVPRLSGLWGSKGRGVA